MEWLWGGQETVERSPNLASLLEETAPGNTEKNPGSGIQQNLVHMQALPLTAHMPLSKALNTSEQPFPHSKHERSNGDLRGGQEVRTEMTNLIWYVAGGTK